MTRAGRKAGSGSRSLAPDEAELWAYATRSLAKVKAKQRVTAKAKAAAEAEETPPRRHPAVPDRDAPPARRAAPAATPGRSPPAAAGPSSSRPPPLADFDRREARRISAGKAEVEARVDLHGLRQRDAHARLRAFLFDAHARGLKTVLVITGKGGSERARDAPAADDQPRGVLRRNVPHWLREADLQSIVVSFTEAGARHGGSGALYVRLRRRGRVD